MNRQAAADFRAADAQLTRVYHKVLASAGEEGKAKLIKAQRAWIFTATLMQNTKPTKHAAVQ